MYCLPNVHPLLGEVVRSLEPTEEDEENQLVTLWNQIQENHLTNCTVQALQLILNILQVSEHQNFIVNIVATCLIFNNILTYFI